VHPHIPIPFPNPHFPNPIPFPPKNIETEVEIGFFCLFPSVFIANWVKARLAYVCLLESFKFLFA
jgi:hypothetical protein